MLSRLQSYFHEKLLCLCWIILLLQSCLWLQSCATDHALSSQRKTLTPTSPEPAQLFSPNLPSVLAYLRQAGFWINDVGPSGPLFSGSHQYPFVCTTVENGWGQPLVDNHTKKGNAVFPLKKNGKPDFNAEPIGYSADCGLPTQVVYYYYSHRKQLFLPLTRTRLLTTKKSNNPQQPSHFNNLPDDIQSITLNGEQLPFIVRVEMGSLNRFLYTIAMLAPYPESLGKPSTLDNRAWNHKLIYKFQGGVGIGHWQGRVSLKPDQALYYNALLRGYAVAFSTGTRTSTHYNLQLSEETAWMLKQHFIKIYGKPLYTIGIGGSGGAVQQYILGQNNPGIIDGAIAQSAYSDMVTQSTYVGDCELLEHFFDRAHPTTWAERQYFEGMAVSSTADVSPWNKNPYPPKPGSSTCIQGWRGSIPTVFNPLYADGQYFKALKHYRYPPELIDSIQWTHWNDLGNIYPKDNRGIALNTWGNEGVQYGLQALKEGKVSKSLFLTLNACVGGWKKPSDMTLKHAPWNHQASIKTMDPWHSENINFNRDCKTGSPSPRTPADQAAIDRAIEFKQVFNGDIDIPVMDVRWYLEPVLDMHHSHASFAARSRIITAKGHADNQIIWIAQCSDYDPVTLKKNCRFDPTPRALDTLSTWLDNQQQHPDQSLNMNKPRQAVDSCFDGKGTLLHAGKRVWDGVLNDQPQGSCHQRFPIYSTSRVLAGLGHAGDRFVCQKIPVKEAIQKNIYGLITFNDSEIKRLEEIFSTGVCDTALP